MAEMFDLPNLHTFTAIL